MKECTLLLLCPVSDRFGVGTGHLNRLLYIINDIVNVIPDDISISLAVEDSALAHTIVSGSYKLLEYVQIIFLPYSCDSPLNADFLNHKFSERSVFLLVDSPEIYSWIDCLSSSCFKFLYFVETRQYSSSIKSIFHGINPCDFPSCNEWIKHQIISPPPIDLNSTSTPRDIVLLSS